MSEDSGMRLNLRHSATAPWSLFLAIERKPKLHRLVLGAMHSEVVQTLYDRYPKALPVPDDYGWLLDRLSEAFVALARKLVEGKPACDVEPRDSLVVVVAAIAYLWYPFAESDEESVPPRPSIRINNSQNLDVEGLRDTIEVWLCNYLGGGQALRDALIGELHCVCDEATECELQDAIQEAMLATDLIYGGATPGLVRQIVETGEVGIEAELLFGIGKENVEKETLVAKMRDVHADLTERYKKGPILDDYASWVEEMAAGGGLIRGMRGRWIELLRELLYVLPPDTATALLFGKGSDVHKDAETALKRALNRHEKRDQRDGLRLEEMDRPIATDDGDASLHDVIPDTSAYIEIASTIGQESVLDAITASTEEQQVLRLRLQGHTQQAIADQLGRSQGWVSNVIKRLRARAAEID